MLPPHNERALRRARAAALGFALLFTFTTAMNLILVVSTPADRGSRIMFGLLCAAAALCLWFVWRLIDKITED